MATYYVSLGENFWTPSPHPIASTTVSDTIICTSPIGFFTCIVLEWYLNSKVKKFELLDSIAYFDLVGNYIGSDYKVG